MAISDRKAKEREELRALILESARKEFVSKGIDQTTIRSIAENIDYSVGTVYKYFRDKNAILHALHTSGFVDLGGKFQVLFSVEDPMERLRAMGRVYIKFALSQPDMYDLMFSLKAPIDFLDKVNKEEWNEGIATFDVLRKTVSDCMKAGHFAGHQVEPLAFLIWSTVHGMCMLDIRQRTRGVHLKNPETIVNMGYEAFLKILEKK
jgi:AcrR family transcriptional regulator